MSAMEWVQMREICETKVLKTQCQVEEELHSLIQAALFYTRICYSYQGCMGLAYTTGILLPILLMELFFTQQ